MHGGVILIGLEGQSRNTSSSRHIWTKYCRVVVKQAKGRGSTGRMFYHYLDVVGRGREASSLTSGCSV